MSPPQSEPKSTPQISLANNLEFSVTVYDSFSDKDKSNYFGTLTSIATVPAKTTAQVELKHPASVLIISNATSNSPLARIVYLQDVTTGPFAVGEADVKAMAETMDFIKFITNNKNDPLTEAFNAIWKDTSKPQVTSVNKFFAQNEKYKSCTFATYMMGITYQAEQPESKGKPMDQALYSLSTLATLLGASWPEFLPDIVVTKFTCNTDNDILFLLAGIDLKKLPAQSDQALQFFGSLFNVQQLQVSVMFNYQVGLNIFGTRLAIGLDAMHVPFGGAGTLTINKPTATIDINPLFKFVVFTVTGEMPFDIFGTKFEADVSMTIDNIEASFGVVIKGDKGPLPPPPVMKGVHFDSFGVGIGIIFEPPSAAIGLSGQFHIGEAANNSIVPLDDNSFVVVCQLIEEVPNPLYISFYVPKMHLTDVYTVFTNAQCPVDVPVLFSDLSFQWPENPMQPVVLPDGSLSNMGYGFSAAADIFGLEFYGNVELDLDNGVKADIEMSPLSLGNIFSIKGDGAGVSLKVDANGNPIKNNQIITKAAQKQALKDATMKQMVPPGGAVLKIQTFASPFLHINGSVNLFEVVNWRLDADITSSGIKFEVGFGGILTSTMSCTLTDWHNLAASFTYGLNDNISLGSIAGVSLGSIRLEALVGAHFALNTSSSDIVLSVGGNFDFEGINRSFGDFTADVNISSVSNLLDAILNYIQSNVKNIFGDLVNEAGAWASKVQQSVIQEVDSVAHVLQNAFDQDANQVAATMKDAGFAADTIASGLRQAFGQSATAIAQTMQQVGFAGEEVASALQSVFGNDAAQIASALQTAYGWSADQIQGVLGQIGFAANDIAQAFQSLGGEFEDLGNQILHSLDPSNWPNPFGGGGIFGGGFP
ncbi:hypothetical protein F53441_9728 [Fusarium austroafricanum]|uniref:Uncharacterized protein n=1 Tax=Fusarium austroafricanum TaxID=2364996 RepID=A0A8H4NW50_9HYPO|nr:hypothetical protein F53441_9728 [Fusarium austroafricanum]